MGYKEMDQVYAKSKAVRIDKFVLITIAKTYNVGRGSWPSQATIAKACGISDARGVRRSLQRLMDLGELVWIRGSNNSGKSNVYFIPFLESKLTDLSAITDTKMSGVSDQNVRLTSDQIDPLLNKGLNKLDKPSFMVFDSNPDSVFGKHIWGQRPSLSKLQVYEWLQAFERDKAFIIENAHTESLVKHVLAYIPSTEGEM
jgi:Helix-turn-helix domain